MATTYQEYTGNASTTTFSYPFPVLKTEDIKVALNGVTQTTGYTATTSPAQVVFSSAPASGVVVRVYRDTDVDSAKGVFAAGSSIRAVDLNNNQDQVLYALQEEQNQKGIYESISLDDSRSIKFGNSDDASIYWDATGDELAHQLQITSAGPMKLSTGNNKNVQFSEGGDVVFTVGPDITAYVDVKPNADGTIDLGASNKEWKDLYVDGTGYIDTISADNITVSGNVDGRDISADGTKLDTVETNAKDDQTAAEIKTLLQSNKLTEAEIAVGTLDNRYYTETEADARFYNLASAEEIQSGETWVAADNKLATTAAIDARIVDLVDDVGGFVPIANETSFPNSNPDVNNGEGTLISVPLVNNLTSNQNGIISINNGTVGNSTVTIVGAGLNTTYSAGFGIIVETLTTLNTYHFHRYVPKATEVTTVAGNIANINAVVSNQTNINAAVSNATNINAVATNISNVNTVAGISSDVTAVAGDAADIGACSTNIGSIAAIGSDLAGNFENITDHGSITGAVTSTSGTSDITTVANSIANVNTVAGISSNVTTVAGDTTAINNITTNLTAVQNAATNATNAASSATAAATSETNAATSATTSTTKATQADTAKTAAETAKTAAETAQTAAAASATSSAASASTSTAQAATATTQASNASTSAANALAYKNLALTYRNEASAILTQVESAPYNLSDSASTHTAWGNITDTGANAVFTNESSNTLLTMAEGSSSYNYGSIT